MEKLKKLIQDLESKIPNQEILNPAISKSSVGWHIEHSLLTIILIVGALQKSNPENYKWKFNFKRVLIFTINKIPRGRAKAPKVVQPKEDVNIESLRNHLEKGKAKLAELNSISDKNYFEHPYLGHLTLKPTIKFLEIHTNHHLQIINDIIKSNS
ncbi:hypothetical protein [Flavobacterium aestivum]|uniref:hypothetical protein n=1 Tax=Flavobacterium aestivum TaxID=3003257 RepID=UPI00228553F3|nr:hypothetical protein [Flavobacterium aestivum]